MLTGVYLPLQTEGFQGALGGMVHNTYIDAYDIKREKKKYTEMALNEDFVSDVQKMSKEKDIYNKLSQSIAPNIFGMEEVKKALLLLMVGGTTQQFSDGVRIRGDINCALIGDPGIAKS